MQNKEGSVPASPEALLANPLKDHFSAESVVAQQLEMLCTAE